VGGFVDTSGNTHGFLDIGGIFTTINVPGASVSGTKAIGINDSGQIVGVFFDATGEHGFIATPAPTPEPGTLLLLSVGLLGLAMLSRRRSSRPPARLARIRAFGI
jgi:hypothetical protein